MDPVIVTSVPSSTGFLAARWFLLTVHCSSPVQCSSFTVCSAGKVSFTLLPADCPFTTRPTGAAPVSQHVCVCVCVFKQHVVVFWPCSLERAILCVLDLNGLVCDQRERKTDRKCAGVQAAFRSCCLLNSARQNTEPASRHLLCVWFCRWFRSVTVCFSKCQEFRSVIFFVSLLFSFSLVYSFRCT